MSTNQFYSPSNLSNVGFLTVGAAKRQYVTFAQQTSALASYAPTSALANYLPLAGGSLNGTLAIAPTNNSSAFSVTGTNGLGLGVNTITGAVTTSNSTIDDGTGSANYTNGNVQCSGNVICTNVIPTNALTTSHGGTGVTAASTGTGGVVLNNTPTLITPVLGTASVTGFSTIFNANASFNVDTGTKTANAISGAATLNKLSGAITTESLTTAAGAAYTLTVTAATVAAADHIFVSVAQGTSNLGTPMLGLVQVSNGAWQAVIKNTHSSAALNGTLVINFLVVRA